jgi:hypothetical protein
MILAIWQRLVWNNACNGWDGYAMLAGINWDYVDISLPYLATATVFITAGNYAMQLERNNIIFFYDLKLSNLTAPYNNITYDARTLTTMSLTSMF